MKLFRLGTAAGAAATAALLASGSVLAAQGGDNNKGDVWVDTASGARTGVTAAGPGHEMDPHLPCGSVGVFAAKMADSSGRLSIFSWPPTGSQQDIYDTTWTYTAGAADPQEIAIIPASVFGTGGHFKLAAAQDPAKYKVFWIDCTPNSTAAAGQTTTTTPEAKENSGDTEDSTGTATAPGTTTAPVAATAPVSTPSGSVESATASTSTTAPSSTTATGPGAINGATVGTPPFGSVEAAVATTAAAAGVALAVTGAPILGLVLGILLLAIGGVILYRRRTAV